MLALIGALIAAPIHLTENPNYCLDLWQNNIVNEAVVGLHECNGTPAQDWDVGHDLAVSVPIPVIIPANQTAGAATNHLVDPATPAKDGYHVVFSDEFNGTSLDLTKWNLITDGSGGGNNELEYYVAFPANHSVANSVLTIHAQQQSFLGKPWTSAKLTTLGIFDFTEGYIEFRAKIPGGQGAWPALWAMPKDSLYGVWPTSGEIDIMEILGGDPAKLYGTLHYGNPWPNQQQIGGMSQAASGTDYSQGYHTYGADWQSDHIDFYVDGNKYFTVKATDASWKTDAQGAQASTGANGWPFNQPYYLIMNLAVGGAWPGAPDPKYTSFDFQIDYARVFAKN